MNGVVSPADQMLVVRIEKKGELVKERGWVEREREGQTSWVWPARSMDQERDKRHWYCRRGLATPQAGGGQ